MDLRPKFPKEVISPYCNSETSVNSQIASVTNKTTYKNNKKGHDMCDFVIREANDKSNHDIASEPSNHQPFTPDSSKNERAEGNSGESDGSQQELILCGGFDGRVMDETGNDRSTENSVRDYISKLRSA